MSAMPGQRIIVLISPGFLAPTEYQSDESDILDRAIKANVVINSLDARGLWTDPMLDASRPNSTSTPAFLIAKQQFDRTAAFVQSDVLAEMADGTGGKFFENNNDLDQGMSQLAAAPEYHYVIAFSPQNLKLDGSYHTLKVTVKTTPPVSFNIQARKGYYAPRRPPTPKRPPRRRLRSRCFPATSSASFRWSSTPSFQGQRERRHHLGGVPHGPRHFQFKKADGRNSNVLTVVSAVFDRNGNFLSGIEKRWTSR